MCLYIFFSFVFGDGCSTVLLSLCAGDRMLEQVSVVCMISLLKVLLFTFTWSSMCVRIKKGRASPVALGAVGCPRTLEVTSLSGPAAAAPAARRGRAEPSAAAGPPADAALPRDVPNGLRSNRTNERAESPFGEETTGASARLNDNVGMCEQNIM